MSFLRGLRPDLRPGLRPDLHPGRRDGHPVTWFLLWRFHQFHNIGLSNETHN